MPEIIDQYGKPISRQHIGRVRARALVNGGVTPYDSADMMSPEMASWQPWLGSPDTETNPYRDRSVSRIRDLTRNDGWAAGASNRLKDCIVGSNFHVSPTPNYRALARWYGPAFDSQWAKEFAECGEGCFSAWANDDGHWCDTTRHMSFGQMAGLACRHYLVEGEAVGHVAWRDDRRGYGRARYATTLQVIDPDRLSNPNMVMDQRLLRGGVEMDEDGAPVAYHFRKAHMNDWFDAANSVTWERIEREEAWGRPKVVHHFDADRAGQHRPIGGMFTPVLGRMRMLAQYDRVELQAAMVNALFGAYIKSPFDPDDIEESLKDRSHFSEYQNGRYEFHQERRIMAGNVELTTLYPGEDISVIASSRPSAAFEAFQATILRNLAAALGVSYETISGDYRGSSYSSARQALLNEWRTIGRRRADFGAGFCTPVYVALLEEMIDRGDVPLPVGAPDFAEARAEYARCKWIGPGRGWVDPTKEVEGSKLKMAAGLSTLQREAEEGDGSNWIENLDQMQLEKQEAEQRGLNLVHDSAVAQATAQADAQEGRGA